MGEGKVHADIMRLSPQGIFSISPVDADSHIPQLPCPDCGSEKTYLNGKRTLGTSIEVQRYLCRCCGKRFSGKPLKSQPDIDGGAKYALEEAKNLPVPKAKHLGTRELTVEERATLKVFEGWLQKEGYKPNKYPQLIGGLLYRGADINDPEDVKEKIGVHNVKNGSKMMICYAYEAYLRMQKMTWERPGGRKLCYRQEENILFIPEEGELDQLVAAAQSKRMAAYLQTLKETFADPGEALAIEWVDVLANAIVIRHPVKDHRPGTLEVSEKLIAMLKLLPHVSNRVFPVAYNTMCHCFVNLRRRIAFKTQNPRLESIELRSFRHWGGTRLAELSNGNACTVMKFLRHKSIANTMKYIDIWKLSFKTETEYEYLAVTTADELKAALLGGYQLVIEKFGASWFRRPKRIAIAGTPVNMRSESETVCIKEKADVKNL
ncbi:MAG: IS1/IS1595 family N-terminal zinc-binding domain-containing protein [Candidatus Bathyarchaeia archaeon]